MSTLRAKASSWTPSVQPPPKRTDELAVLPLPTGLMETLEKLYHTKFQKEEIGEHLYPLVEELNSEFAGKVTGMLLERNVDQLLIWLSYPAELSNAVNSAVGELCPPPPMNAKQDAPQVFPISTSEDSVASVESVNIDDTLHRSPPIESSNLVSPDIKDNQKHMHNAEEAQYKREVEEEGPHQSASLFISGLQPTITEKDIFDRFNFIPCVNVSSVRLLRDKYVSRSAFPTSISAFVHFASQSDALCALVEVGPVFDIYEEDVVFETDLY